MEILKKCTTCNTDQPISQFRKQSKNKDGLKYTCKNCDDIRAKERYAAKKDHIISKVKTWQTKNKEKTQDYKRRYLYRKFVDKAAQIGEVQ